MDDASRLTVALDCDGTVYPLAGALASWWMTKGLVPELPAEPDCWHWWRAAGITDRAFRRALVAFGEDDGYRHAPPYDDARMGIEMLFDAGLDLVLVTSRPATRAVEASTYGWVSDWFLPVRSVHIGPTAKMDVECDVLVDDDPVTLVELGNQGEAVGLLLARPWNEAAVGLPRVSWLELPGLLGEWAVACEGCKEWERRGVLADLADQLIK